MRTKHALSLVGSLAGLAGAAALLLGSAAAGAAPEEPGPPVGAAAPAFSLVDQKGERRDLAGLLPKGDGKLAVVFFRSADW